MANMDCIDAVKRSIQPPSRSHTGVRQQHMKSERECRNTVRIPIMPNKLYSYIVCAASHTTIYYSCKPSAAAS